MIQPLYILLWAAIIGATSAGITVALRGLPFIYRKVEAAKKPWACDVCMSFWTTGLLGLGLGAWAWNPWYLVVCGPAYPWAMYVLCKITEPTGPPPMAPLEDSEEEDA